MESVQCPSCHRSFADATLLLLHHEYEPCQESGHPSAAFDNLICPICDKIFYDPLVLQIHVNEEHDQPRAHTTSDSLYAQELARRDNMRSQYEQHQQESASAFAYEDWPDDDDAQIARMLQEEENAQSCQEFQTQHSGSTRTFSERARWNLDKIFGKKMISQQKYNEYREKLDEMIAQPVERMESRSSGLIPVLSRLPMGNLLERRLCRPGCDHMSSTWLDQGWACGYKNFQMLLSSLRQDPQYAAHLFGANVENQDIPSVSRLQALIERAWEAGFDSAGRAQLNRQLVNSTKWIGPTEVMACLAHLNIKTELFDFYQPKTIDKNVAYKYLFEWVRNYFRQQPNGNNVVHPLYLQHEGHSRTIIGYEQFRNVNIRLLMFDPGTPKPQIEQFRADPNDKAHIFRRSLQSFQKPVYQILVARGLLRPDEREAAKRVRSSTVPMPKP